MNQSNISYLSQQTQKTLWNQRVYANFCQEIDPFQNNSYFRPLTKAYTGDNTFWSIPSPEPNIDDAFWEKIKYCLNNNKIKQAGVNLANSIKKWETNGNKLIFIAILRAGVPIADWLCRLIPGSIAVSISLFVGLGIDQLALSMIKDQYPDRKIIFVDGWTGKGGVSREINKIGHPLAVLIDPWAWSDFAGCYEDIFCPTACFTGVTTLGFSRTFYTDSSQLFSAYLFPKKYWRTDLIKSWQNNCPKIYNTENIVAKTNKFFKPTDLRIHSNEVCRALINAAPKKIFFLNDINYVKKNFNLLLDLAKRRDIKISYNVDRLKKLHTRVACSLNIEKI